jgi:hypothetical protein
VLYGHAGRAPTNRTISTIIRSSRSVVSLAAKHTPPPPRLLWIAYFVASFLGFSARTGTYTPRCDTLTEQYRQVVPRLFSLENVQQCASFAPPFNLSNWPAAVLLRASRGTAKSKNICSGTVRIDMREPTALATKTQTRLLHVLPRCALNRDSRRQDSARAARHSR